MSAVALASVSLDDKYDLVSGRVLMSGTQVLVRLPLLQRAVDQALGRNTAGFITGYRGSPLGMYDMELWGEAERLKASHIVFRPGVNEDLAATAVWGTQQAPLLPGARLSHFISGFRKASFTVPVGPLRCLPMMTSAMPLVSSFSGS